MGIAFRALTTLSVTVALIAAAFAQAREEGRGSDIHFRGPVFALSRDLDDNVVEITVRVNQSQIDVGLTGWTEVIQGRGFHSDRNDLALGDFVQVGGFFTSRGRIMARRIHVENRDDLELEGRVELISGNLLRVAGIDFLVEPESVIRAAGSRARRDPADLGGGMPVRIRASEDAGLWRIRELEFGERSVESEPLRFEGVIRKIEGDLVSIDVGIPGVWALVAVPYGTPLAGARELRPDLLVEIEGRFLPGTALVRADRIAVDTNRNQNVFDDVAENGAVAAVELEGRVRNPWRRADGSVRQFHLNETIVQVDGQTRLYWRHGEPAHGRDLEDGLPVRVEGQRLPDRSVRAIRIELRPEDEADSEDPANGGTNGETPNGPGDDEESPGENGDDRNDERDVDEDNGEKGDDEDGAENGDPDDAEGEEDGDDE